MYRTTWRASLATLEQDRQKLEEEENSLKQQIEHTESKRSWFAAFRDKIENVAAFLDTKVRGLRTVFALAHTVWQFPMLEKVEQEQIARKAATNADPRSKQWRAALKKLQIDTTKSAPAPVAGELTPDSMTSRINDSAIVVDDLDDLEDGLKFTSMGSRVNSMTA